MEKVIQALLDHEKVKNILFQLEQEEDRTLQEQMELCSIPSPSNCEEARAKHYLEMFRELSFDEVWMDQVWNVFGLLKGTGKGPKVLISAHMDTVFDLDTNVKPWIDGNGIVHAPGIGDDTRGMAEVLGIARAMLDNHVRPVGDILFCGDVGEETLGNLRGVRNIFKTMNDIDCFISIDSLKPEMLNCHGVAGVKRRVTYSGTGGHAFRMFGYPNANNALGRAIEKISNIQVPEDPVTTFNVGVVKGGTSISGIPTESQMLVDARSIDNGELERLCSKIKSACEDACEEENLRWFHPTEKVTVLVEEIGKRPGGRQDVKQPLIRAAAAATEAFGMTPVFPKGSSTDSNLPISLGIPSVTVGRGGELQYGHTIHECYNPKNASLGPKRDVILLLIIAGYEGVCEPLAL